MASFGRRAAVALSLFGIGLVSACGKDNECGPWTKLQGHTCVGTVTCAPGTVLIESEANCVPEQVAIDSAPSAWAANVRVSPTGLWAGEPSLAVDSAGRIFAATMLKRTAGGMPEAVLYKSDDGVTFTEAATSTSLRGGFTGDVSVAVDSSDYVYFAYVDYGASGMSFYPPGDIYVQVSADHGATFKTVKVNQDTGFYFSDRPWVVTAPAGEMLISFTHNSTKVQNDQQLPVMRSADHGATWTLLGDIAGRLFSQQIFTDGQFPVARNAAAYFLPRISYGSSSVDYEEYLDVYRTTDFATFTSSRIARIYANRDLAVDSRAVPTVGLNGEIYLTYLNASSRNTDLFFSKSVDNGSTFTTPTVIHPMDGGSTQTMPWIAVDPASGYLHLIWLDNHTGQWNVVAGLSKDNGDSFTLSRVSDQYFVEDSTQNKWLGDFNAVSANAGKVCAIWTDTRDGMSAAYLSCRPAP